MDKQKENLNDTVNDIIQDINDSSKRLSDTLRKALVFAYKTQNSQLTAWILSELNGYAELTNDNCVPAYRKFSGLIIKGRFVGRIDAVLPIPDHIIDKAYIDSVKSFNCIFSISELESVIITSTEFIPLALDVEIAHTFSAFAPGNTCIAAWRQCPKAVLCGILDNVKTKLLLFFLELQKRYPEINIEILRKDPTLLKNIMNSTIIQNIVTDSTNVSLPANVNSPNSSINANVNDISALIEALKEFNLPTNITDELRKMDTRDKGFNEKLKEWFKNLPFKMANKTLDAITITQIGIIISKFQQLFQ